MITKIGYVHFVDNYDKHFRFLDEALSAQSGYVRDSLIVLPEAFNYGRSYSEDRGHPVLLPLLAALETLSAWSIKYEVTFVVGLLEDGHVEDRRNSAYLIHRAETKLMRHKRTEDSTGMYKPSEVDCGTNPVDCEGAHVGVLLCNEAEAGPHISWLAEELGKNNSARRKLICLPAHMNDGFLDAPSLQSAHWFGNYVILANSSPYGTKSFIANKSRTKDPETGVQLLVKAWDELDGL